ncbi:dTMP kinase [Dolosigranulum pigrum]|uniref:Thymidylate kinase n=1 Tax=Dolosigranulum pigrum ATCC 51524 TaxID=883103 RepID=H3NCD0_9LACT|nr:dTMP kinase [Dolosigranulum pigrum]EHR35363.1 thymidylate kinase [Dolosigranulum pigrum ATCC 51524]
MSEGLFITVEGPDGAGKSTLIQGLKERLEARTAREVILTREPGGSPLAEVIREVLLDNRYGEMDGRTEALLMAASRRQHIVDTILPALEAGKIVLSDRYVDSSLAYQGAGRELGIEAVRTINAFAIEEVVPTVTILLDVDAQTGLARIHDKQSGRAVDRLEQEDISFHNRVRSGYQTLREDEPDRFIYVDATCEPATVLEESWKLLNKYLDKLVDELYLW